jgi:hypothetical protein
MTHATTDTMTDSRTPSPPFGYSRECHFPLEQRIRIVAEFYVHKIRPSRIAYRMGIDIDLVDKLIAGDIYQDAFDEMVAHYRKHRRSQRLKDSQRLKGGARMELQTEIEREFTESNEL